RTRPTDAVVRQRAIETTAGSAAGPPAPRGKDQRAKSHAPPPPSHRLSSTVVGAHPIDRPRAPQLALSSSSRSAPREREGGDCDSCRPPPPPGSCDRESNPCSRVRE